MLKGKVFSKYGLHLEKLDLKLNLNKNRNKSLMDQTSFSKIKND